MQRTWLTRRWKVVKRIDNSQAGKRHGNPALEIERICKAELELTQSKMKRSKVEAGKNAALHGVQETSALPRESNPSAGSPQEGVVAIASAASHNFQTIK